MDQDVTQAMRDGKCDGVVTYCLDKGSGSRMFDLTKEVFLNARKTAHL